jgi:hypothetical protein
MIIKSIGAKDMDIPPGRLRFGGGAAAQHSANSAQREIAAAPGRGSFARLDYGKQLFVNEHKNSVTTVSGIEPWRRRDGLQFSAILAVGSGQGAPCLSI